MVQHQIRCFGEQVFKNDIEPGGDPADERVGQSP